MSIREDDFKRLNADLGLEFHLFMMEHPEWAAQNIPLGAIVVLQTDDADFNAWAQRLAEKCQLSEHVPVPRPVVLVHLRELRPARSRIVRAEAELLPPIQQLN